MKAVLGSVSLGVLLGGMTACTTFEPERGNVVEAQIPEAFGSASGSVELQAAWWKSFASPQLNQLMDKAFAGNLTLEQAVARLQQSAAAARLAGAEGGIQLDGDLDYAATRSDGATARTASLGLTAGYELDLWGRIASTENAALATWEATSFDLQTAAMTLSAEVATQYFTWLTQKETLAVYESQQQSNLKKLQAIERRYHSGQSTVLDLLQQRQLVAADEAKLPPVRAQIQNTENAIALLLGQIPGQGLGLEVEDLPALPPQPSAGLPVNLLENRPDIQSARLALVSSDWSVGAARAARLPTLSLRGSVYTNGEGFEDLFDDWVSNLAANLLAPLMDGGARKTEVERTLAVSRERIAAYRLSVLEAIGEVEDALSNEKFQAAYLAALQKQYVAAQKSEAESIRRYQRGIITYLDTLTAIVAREDLEITMVNARMDLLSTRIQLYRSLGGDWSTLPEEK
ncbi:efflux transporter outer membrane subunit [Kiritimatiellaeota bacterium B1221]|nr:efflux transporter outer membrane subunit [Kiritimatiellaeota bacterium B1221]